MIFSTLYQDEYLIALDKPSGLICHPVGHYQGNTLKAQLECEFGPEARPLHRLDKDTSGVMLIGRSLEIVRSLYTQFEKRTIEKEYLALVYGYVEEVYQDIQFPLGEAPPGTFIKVKTWINENGVAAHTKCQVLSRNEKYSLLSIQLVTGRKHQIRIHLAAIGHPIVGDTIYHRGGLPFLWEYYLNRQSPWHESMRGHALHAHRLTFTHPINGQRLTVTAPIPRDFREYAGELVEVI